MHTIKISINILRHFCDFCQFKRFNHRINSLTNLRTKNMSGSIILEPSNAAKVNLSLLAKRLVQGNDGVLVFFPADDKLHVDLHERL